MSRRADREPRRRGFSLLEAVAALAIVGASAAALLGASASELRSDGRVEHVLAADALARQRIAVLRLLPHAELRRLPDSLARGAFAPPLERYRWRAAAAPVDGAPDLFALRVAIAWDGGELAVETRHYAPRDFLRGR